MRLRRFKGTILVSALISAPFIIDECSGDQVPGEEGRGGLRARVTEDGGSAGGRVSSMFSGVGLSGGSTSGSGPGSPRDTQSPGTGGSRMGGDSRMGGNSMHGLDSGGAGAAGPALGGPGRESIF